MASIKIRQNIFGYQKKRKGFTTRQMWSAILAGIVLVSVIAGLWFGLHINYQIAITVGFILAMPLIYAGFAKVFGMNAEEALVRIFRHLGRKGMVLQTEKIEDYESGVNREYTKTARSEKGFECIKSKAKPEERI